MREIWKPLIVVLAAIGLIGWGIANDPSDPRCGDQSMRPDMLCEVNVKGTVHHRTHDEIVAQTRAWRIGAPIAGVVVGLLGAAWLVVSVRREPAPARAVIDEDAGLKGAQSRAATPEAAEPTDVLFTTTEVGDPVDGVNDDAWAPREGDT